LIEWACERSQRDPAVLADRFPKLDDWQSGKGQPTIKQLERFAAATRTPFGFFFLSEPPVEKLPIPDFRTIGSGQIRRPSPDLLDTIYLCQQRQDWYQHHARLLGEDRLEFVGSAATTDGVVETARTIRAALRIDLTERRLLPTWEDALRRLIEQADGAGVLVMVSGVVGHNSHRALNPEEFRGFALADPLAPLVFINGADTKSAQMFTLAHELAHLWLGQSGVSDITPASKPTAEVEKWCNAVAAEVLVPLSEVRTALRRESDLWSEVSRLSRQFKVSTLVILRRIHDAGGLTRDEYWAAHQEEVDRLLALIAKAKQAGGGGNYYLTTAARVSKRFARAVLASTWEGRSTFTEAFRLLGCGKVSSLITLGDSLGLSAPVSHMRSPKEEA